MFSFGLSAHFFDETLVYNVVQRLRLGDVAEIEAQNFNFVQKFNRRTELEFSTSAAILPNRCCAFGFYSVLFNVQMIAFSFVALKIVLCFSFGSFSYFQFNPLFSFLSFSFKSFVYGAMSTALEPANQSLVFV